MAPQKKPSSCKKARHSEQRLALKLRRERERESLRAAAAQSGTGAPTNAASTSAVFFPTTTPAPAFTTNTTTEVTTSFFTSSTSTSTSEGASFTNTTTGMGTQFSTASTTINSGSFSPAPALSTAATSSANNDIGAFSPAPAASTTAPNLLVPPPSLEADLLYWERVGARAYLAGVQAILHNLTLSPLVRLQYLEKVTTRYERAHKYLHSHANEGSMERLVKDVISYQGLDDDASAGVSVMRMG